MNNMSLNVKLFIVLMLGLTVLGSSDVTFALPKLKGNKTYCDCSCMTFSGGKELVWEKVASCSVNGKACSATNSTGQLEPGTLKNCQTCTTGGDGNFNNCVSAGLKVPGSGETIPEPGGMAPPPATSPKMPGTVAPGMRDPIMRRGIDDVELLPAPPPGAEEPATGGKGK